MDGGNREDFAHDSWGGKLEDSRRVVDLDAEWVFVSKMDAVDLESASIFTLCVRARAKWVFVSSHPCDRAGWSSDPSHQS